MKGNDARTGPDHSQPRPRPLLAVYERFEQLVAIALSILIVLIVIVALVELVREVLVMVREEAIHPLQQETFQLVFGMIMTLLIALEFKHSIVKVALHHESIVQVRTVILIALLALARKFVILDVQSPAQIAALALALLALGLVYGVLSRRDQAGNGPPRTGGTAGPAEGAGRGMG